MVTFRFKSLQDIDAQEGTVKLVDDARQHKYYKNTDITLVPQPSDDVNDPLNWPKWKKTFAFISICFLTFLASWVMGGIALGIPGIMTDFGISLNQTVRGVVSWTVFTNGIGNFFWTPLALYFGKRPVFLFAACLAFIGTIWSASAHSYASLVVARAICAFTFSAAEGLSSALEADIFFLHERGWWMGLYLVSLLSGASLGGLMSGFIITAKGWRWHFWVSAIFVGVDFLMIFFLFPETRYARDTDVESPVTAASDKSGGDEIHSVETPPQIAQDSDAEKSVAAATDTSGGEEIHSVEAQTQGSHSRKKTYLEQLNPWSGISKDKNLLLLLLRPLPIFVYPAITFAIFAFASAIGFIVAVLSTNAAVFQSPPYNMTAAINGLINIPALIGTFLGAYCGGGLTDKIAEWQARRNNGIFEPEARLVALIIPFIITPAGLLMYGFGIQHQTHWALPFIGYGLVSFGVTAVPSITMTYVLDSCLPVGYEALVLVNALKQIFAFGFAYGIIPWVTLDGYAGAFGAMAGIQVGFLLFGLPLWYYGKEIRRKTGAWKIILY